MLDEQRARHLPAARGLIRKRRPFLNPRAIITDDEDSTLSLTGPVTLTITSTLADSTTSSLTVSRTSTSIKPPIPPTISSSTASSTRLSSSSSSSSSSSTSHVTAPSPSASAVQTGTSDNAVGSSSTGTSSGLSGGAVAAISIGVLVLVAAAAVLIGRRCMARRRQQRRTATARWLSGFTASNPAAGTRSGPGNYSSNQPPMNMVSPSYGDGYAYTGTLTASGGMGPSAVAAPPVSYNNVPSTAGLSPQATINRSTVRCTFVPNLPDELTILNGEVLDVLQEYDDGWVLARNAKGDAGMVPLECLASGSDTGSDTYGERSRRSSRRVSSMIGTRI